MASMNSSDKRAQELISTPNIPFSEPPYLLGLPSPYYQESHYKWQKTCRDFISQNLTQHAMQWENEELVPPHVWEDFGKGNMLIPALPSPLPVQQLKVAGIHELPGGLKVEDFDYFHFLIYTDEMMRGGLAGPPCMFPFRIPRRR